MEKKPVTMPSGDAAPCGRKVSKPADSAQSRGAAPDSGDMQPSKPPGINAVSILWTFGKCLGALLPVYLAGYYRISTSLFMCGLMVYSGWKHTRDAKLARLKSAMQLQDNEQEFTSSKMLKSKRDLPAWVNFPDVEKVEWLNKVLQQAWPFVGQYFEKLLAESIAPSIRASSVHLQTLNFTKVDLGSKAMKVVGVKAHTENDRGQVLLDLYISYVGDVEINVEVKRYFCNAGIKGMQLHGMLRVILEPLIGDVPIVGAVTMFFIRRPQLDINWTGLTNLLDIPGLNVKSDTLIMDAIASFLVLPNRLTVPLVPDLHVAQLRSPLPRGVVRVHLLEAEGLAAKDNLMKGAFAGMSDPYAVVRVGTQTFTSRHVDNELNPKWREVYEVIVHEVPGQELEVEVYDKDPDQDDFLGRTKMDLGIVKEEIVVDEWFTLKDVRSGRVHLRLEWLTLLPTTDQLDQVLERNKSINFPSKTADPPSSAILAVYLDRAEELPMKKGNKDPSPVVQLSVEDITRESRTCYGTNNPVFEDAFTFFIQNPHNQEIDIQVKDTDRILSLGSLTIPLSRLLSCPRLSMDQWFQLDNAGPASRIYINAVLRVLWMDEALSAELAHGVHSRPDSQPEQTSPDSSFATEGVLRIHLVEAQNLIAKDKFLGKGKSDPYVNIRVGGVAFRSHAIQKSLNPTWNELYEVVLTEVPGQEVQVDVFDEDVDQDDFMGRFKISLKDIITSQYTDEWFTLNDVKSGRVHLVLEWLTKVSDPDRLEPVLQFQSQQYYLNKAVPSAAVLFVYMDRAHGLPLKKSGKEPKVGAELILRGTSHKTKVCDRSTSPQWDEAFYFLVRDPEQDMLIVKLTHTGDQPTGSRVLPVRELLTEPGLVLDRWLRLDGALFESQILLRAELKILDAKLAERGVVREGLVGVADSTTSAEGEKEADHTLRMKEESSLSRQEKVAPSGVSEVLSPPKTQPQQTTPDPSFAKEGLLRILLVEARDLVAKDKFLGKGKSDPYANIRVGGVAFRSHVIEKNLNPTWNELYEVVLTPQPGQDVQVELFDKDMDKDDFLGRCNVSLNDIITSQYTDQWFTLNDVKSGRVHLVLEWLPKVSDPDRLEQVLQFQSQQSYLNKAVPSAAVLFVYMDRAHGLPMKKSGKEPKVGAELVLGGTSHKTKVCDRSTSPQWDEAFHFLLHDPKHDELIVKLTHTGDQPTGSLVLPVRDLLSEPGLVLDRWLSLDGVPPESQILLRAELKILDTKMAERGVVREELVGVADSTTSAEEEEEADHTLLMKEATSSAYREQVSVPEKDKEATAAEVPSPLKTRPQQTTPDPSFATEGLLRILLVEARDLIAKDKFLGKGKSDPYANIRVGGVAFRSHVIEKNLNPTWNELYEVVLTPQPGQDVQVELFDKDMDKDDFLGKFNVSLNDIITSQYTDQWFTLNDVKSGRVHLVLEWLPKVSDPDRLEQVLQFQSQQSYLNKAVPSAAVLFVYMDRAHGLPMKKSGKEPKVGAELVLGGTSHKTKVCDRSTSPQWDEAFHFLVHDPKHDELIVKLTHTEDQPTGSLVLPVRELLSEPGLVLDRWLSLDGVPPESQILLRAELKILDTKMPERGVLHEELVGAAEEEDEAQHTLPSKQEASPSNQEQERLRAGPTQRANEQGPPSAPAAPHPPASVPEKGKVGTAAEVPSPPKTRPQQTTPDPSFATEGVLRILLVEARDLIAKDKFMGKGKSDPYANIRVGGVAFRSHVIEKNLNPTWNELYEMVLTPQPGQDVQVELFDKDMDKDDFLGKFKVSLKDIITSQYVDQWFTLNDVKSGRVHLVLEWLPKVSDPDRLEQVLQFQSQQSYLNKAVPSAAVLFVYMDRAHGLPMKKSGKEPKVEAELVLGATSHKTKVCDRSTSPQWDEAFHFLVRDPKHDELIVKLTHTEDQPTGSLVLPVRELLSEPGLVLDRWLSLDGVPPESQILLRAELKILDTKMPERGVLHEELVGAAEEEDEAQHTLPSKQEASPSNQEQERLRAGPTQRANEQGPPSAPAAPHPPASVPEKGKVGTAAEVPSPPKTRPQQTTPDPSFATEGVLRILLVEARDLIAKDKFMGKGKSDPYANIRVGGVAFRSHVIEKNLNPTWNELYEMVLTPQPGQDVQVELFDKDMDKDDFLGKFKVSLKDIITSQYVDQWFTLNDVKSGRVHLVLEWLPKVSDPDRLEPILQFQSQQSYLNKAVPSAAVLFVYMDRAHGLPLKMSGKEPKVEAELVVGKTSHKTKVCDRSTSPQWDEAFYFLVHDPKKDVLLVRLTHTGDQPTGSLVLPIRELLSEPGLVLDRWLSLDGVPPESQILLRAELKILDTKMPERGVLHEELVGAAEEEDEAQHTLPSKKEASPSNQEQERLRAGPTQRADDQDPPSAPATPHTPASVPKKEERTAAQVTPGWVSEVPSTPETRPKQTTPEPSFATKMVKRSVIREELVGAADSTTSAEGEEEDNHTLPSKEEVSSANQEQERYKAGPAQGALVTPHPPVSVPDEDEEETTIVPGRVSEVPSPPETRPQQTTPILSFANEGVLRIILLEARNLVAKDNLMGGMVKGKSDPYVNIHVGGVGFRSRVIEKELNPTWNELYEVVLTPLPGQEVKFELYDKDLDSDDFLGRFNVSLSDIIRSQYTDQWFTLNDVKSGRVHLVLEWLPKVSNPDRLEQVLQFQSQQSYVNKAVPSAAVLFVYMDRAHGLPLKKSGKEPKVGAELVLRDTSHKTKVCDRSTSPQWKEAFHFLVHDPKHDMLVVKLTHTGDQPTGSLVLPVKELLSEPGLVLDRWLNLDGVPPGSQILLRAELKILDTKMAQSGVQGGPASSAAANQGLRLRPDGQEERGQVKLSLSYLTKEKKLAITVHACRHLAAGGKEVSDPYVSFILLPDKHKATKRKTSVKKREVSPEYNERFEFALSLEEARRRQLDLSVKNTVSFMNRDREVIGKVQLDLSRVDLATGVTQWYELKEEAG